ncbi:hypothetical protein [Bradyrhizobium sp. 76]|uniref:hypothetical protein n=1 Tax=Bradyrhizobium sp. 76 TaxID=2782680 RepID=UPI001FFAA250|nr:hypothetical protein [Bradyrhizobium sp. 76]MCK1407643.1 hypothetical protein [Bradyrhizobium sp. 76]
MMLTSLSAAAVAAAVVGISTWAVVQLQRAELEAAEAAMNSYKQQSNERIAEANAQAADANKTAAQATEQIAKLSVEAEQARKETASAQLQLQQLKSPRTFNDEKFVAAISGLEPATFEVLYDVNAPDALFLAGVISVAFVKAHWQSAQSLPEPLAPPPESPLRELYWSKLSWIVAAGGQPWGLSVVTKGNPDLEQNIVGRTIVNALADAVSGPNTQVSLGNAVGTPLTTATVRIIIGPRGP